MLSSTAVPGRGPLEIVRWLPTVPFSKEACAMLATERWNEVGPSRAATGAA